jgi:hypothetical protein
LKETFDLVAGRWGEDVARALLIANPLAAFEGGPLPYAPELPDDAGVDESPARGPARRKRFFFF